MILISLKSVSLAPTAHQRHRPPRPRPRPPALRRQRFPRRHAVRAGEVAAAAVRAVAREHVRPRAPVAKRRRAQPRRRGSAVHDAQDRQGRTPGDPSSFTPFRPYLAHFAILPRFFSFFARFHRLNEAVPTSPKPEPTAKNRGTAEDGRRLGQKWPKRKD